MRIRRLSEDVANKIAAGEVVERPAAVVKELVENGLDAQSTRIRVRVEEGGRRSIRVIDDGFGMGPEDALAALERHATSKIERIEDLDDVATLGFRGEALPSIASVSRFRLTTRRAEDAEATRIEVRGGRLGAPRQVGAPRGTQVDVESLFFNVPARLKFMKRPGTEMGHVSEAVTRLALAWPRVAFRLESGERLVLDAPAEVDTDPRGRMGRILGRAAAERLIPIQEDERPHRIDVRGWISEPGFHERTSRSLYVFVNGRFVRDRGIQHAVQEAYRGHLERGRFPVLVLHLALPAGSYDVNVHPQKTEVRFASPQEVFRAVVGALGRTLAAAPWRPRSSGAALLRSIESVPSQEVLKDAPGQPEDAPGQPEDAPVEPGPRRAMFPARAPWPSAFKDGARTETGEGAQGSDAASGGSHLRLVVSELLLSRYLVAASEGGLFLIDGRAAAEKARWLDLEARSEVASQPLLVPLLISLDPRRAASLAEDVEALEALGLSYRDYGENTLAVTAGPPGLDGASLEALLTDLADEARRNRAAERQEAYRRRMARALALPRRLDWASVLLERLSADERLRVGLDGGPTIVALEAGALRRLFRT
ncbi:MAG: DNA mismatch repair endonuclease MutL [Myxococcota bacterium]